MKKVISVLLVISILIALFAACGQGKDNAVSKEEKPQATDRQAKEEPKKEEKKPVTIKAMFWAQEAKDALGKLSEDFTKENPHIKIEWEYPPNSDYKKILSTRILSGESPDTFGLIDSSFYKYATPMDDQPWASRVITKSNLSLKGQLMGVPLTFVGLLVYYNKKVFADAGITEFPKTYDEFLALCDNLKSKKITPIAFGMKDAFVHNVVIAQLAQEFAQKIPKNFFEQLYFGKDKIANYPEFEKAMEKYLELYKKGYFPDGAIGLDYNSVFTMLANGKAAMCIHGSWLPGFVAGINKDAELGAFAFPDGNGTSSVVACNDWNLGIGKDAKNREEILLFFDFLARKESQEYVAEQWQQLSPFKDAQPKLSAVAQETMKVINENPTADFAFYIEVPDPNYELCKISQEMFLGKKTPKQAVEAFDKVCEQYKDSKKAVYEE